MTGTIGLSVFLAWHWSPKQCRLVGENDLEALGGKWGVYMGYLCCPQQPVGLWGHLLSRWEWDSGFRTNLLSVPTRLPLLWLQESLPLLSCSLLLSLRRPTSKSLSSRQLPWFSFLKLQTQGSLVFFCFVFILFLSQVHKVYILSVDFFDTCIV